MDKRTLQKKIAIIGLGYVGLPLALKLSLNFNVVGFDVNSKRIYSLKLGIDITKEVDEKKLKEALKSNLSLSSKEDSIKDCEIFIITVPTPVTKENIPDLTFLEGACNTVGKIMRKNSIVVFESTVYPGVTEDFCGKILEKRSGLSNEIDFFLAYSPERVNPGDKVHTIDKITKVISANNRGTLKILKKIYGSITNGNIFEAESIKVAEASKVIENSQRDINIAFVNEITKICMNLGISIYDVLDASNTKWNFLPFYPGLVGGHCIGVDPYYLAFKSKKIGIKPEVILSGRKTNDEMSKFFGKKILELITPKSKILIFGATFKENVPDTRNSKVFDLINFLKSKKNLVHVCDPYILDKKIHGNQVYKLDELKKNYYDLLILTVNHKQFASIYPKKVSLFMKRNALIFDLTGAWKKKRHNLKYFTL